MTFISIHFCRPMRSTKSILIPKGKGGVLVPLESSPSPSLTPQGASTALTPLRFSGQFWASVLIPSVATPCKHPSPCHARGAPKPCAAQHRAPRPPSCGLPLPAGPQHLGCPPGLGKALAKKTFSECIQGSPTAGQPWGPFLSLRLQPHQWPLCDLK